MTPRARRARFLLSFVALLDPARALHVPRVFDVWFVISTSLQARGNIGSPDAFQSISWYDELLHGCRAAAIAIRTPLIRSIVSDANTLRSGILCPLPHVRQQVLLPLSDAIAEPPPASTRLPLAVLPLHGDITGPGDFRRSVVLVLTGRRVPARPAKKATARMIRDLVAAWQTPSLPLSRIAARPERRPLRTPLTYLLARRRGGDKPTLPRQAPGQVTITTMSRVR